MKTQQQTLWEWAEQSAEEFEELIKPQVRGELNVSELPPARPAVMFERIGQARRLHLELEARLGGLDLVITDNRRRMVSARARKLRQEIRLHHMFLGCEAPIVEDLCAFVQGDDEARERIRRYIQDNREEIRHELAREQLRTLGRFHDLEWILESARGLLEDPELEDIAITWGRMGRGKRSIRFGSYDFDQRLIRVHPALDRRWVPTYFLEYIAYHELLHALYPPEVDASGGRRSVHTEAFCAMEERFPRYEDAIAWESANIKRLLAG